VNHRKTSSTRTTLSAKKEEEKTSIHPNQFPLLQTPDQTTPAFPHKPPNHSLPKTPAFIFFKQHHPLTDNFPP
jgi:hypothetical protein